MEEPLDEGSPYDAEAGVGACGDRASGSRVEGALLSGVELATRILSVGDG